MILYACHFNLSILFGGAGWIIRGEMDRVDFTKDAGE